jgi:hypothetical protein
VTAHKSRRITSHSNLVKEARSGLIPASDDMLDERRIQRKIAEALLRAVRTNAKFGASVADEVVIIEALARLRDYCDRRKLSFDDLSVLGHEQYLEETAT